MSLSNFITSPLARQLWVVSGAYLTMMGGGMIMTVSNGILADLLSHDTDIPIDLESASWINAATSMGCLFAGLIDWPLMALTGRRGSIIITRIPSIISCLICYLATNLTVLLIGRFLSGVGTGSITMAVVIGECTTPEYRGVFLSFKSFTFVLGFALGHILCNYFHWRTVMLIIMVPYVLHLMMAFTWPESPSWLANYRRYDEAIESFYWLRGKSEQSTKEINAMIEAQQKLNNSNHLKLGQKAMSVLEKFTKKNFLKPLGFYTFAALLLESGGRHIFSVYAMQFIQQMDKDKSNVFSYTLCLDFFMCLSTFMSTVLVKIMKRRTLLLGSGAVSVVILLAVSLYYYLQSRSLISERWNPLMLVLFGGYIFLFNGGCAPLLLALIGELFPLEHRSLASSLGGILISIFMVVTVKITPLLLTTIKVYGTFTVYGSCMAVCLVVLYITLPETKDKTLQEIEEFFNDKTRENNEVASEVNCRENHEVSTKLLDERVLSK